MSLFRRNRDRPGFRTVVMGSLVTEDLGYNSITPAVEAFWQSLAGTIFSPRLIDRVWVANRCIQLNAQQIASMPLRFQGATTSFEPAWVSNPDPVWYPNGIGDAVFSAVDQMYRWGDAYLLITSRYANGFPAGWTVLDSSTVSVRLRDGRRRYQSSGAPLDPADVVQISRDPRPGSLTGTSAFTSYAAKMMGTIATVELAQSKMGDGANPQAVLKSSRKLTAEQAQALQAQWVEATSVRRAAPAILPPDLEFEALSFSPKDLLLLDAQEFDARVIASACGVPPFLLNLPLSGGLTYQNPEMLGEFWWRFELRPAALRISRALTANMLPRGQQVAFDAHDTFAPLAASSQELFDSPVAPASPAQQPTPLRPVTSTGGQT